MIKIRQDKSANYKSIFFNGKTIRMRLDNSKPILAPTNPEIEDVAINSKCFANCFIERTPILASNNEEILIEDINIGDKVKSFDEEKNQFVIKEVDDIFSRPYEGDLIVLELENGEVIKCTPEHPFLTAKGWLEAKDLNGLKSINTQFFYCKNTVFLKSIKTEPFKGNVYNFSVKDTHTYIVKGVVVHNCNYCYTSATKEGTNFDNIIDKANLVWGSLPKTERPFQIAIGGAGESTIHPEWVNFVKEVNSLGIMPNYTTNGMHLSGEILKATEAYCGGVAVSYHPHIPLVFTKAIKTLSEIKTRLNVHVILGDEESLSNLQSIYYSYADKLDYIVVLPYQAVGRGKAIETKKVWLDAFEWINTVESSKFAFGALFYNFLLENKVGLNMSIYEPEIYSGYRMMDSSFNILRKSSYDLNPKLKNV